MDAAQALSDLMEISSQVEAAVVLDERSGEPVASTLPDERAARLAGVARDLLAAAGDLGGGDRPVGQLEVATGEGSVFVVRGDEGRAIAAATGPSPTVGLVFYDLKTCLRALEQAPKPRRRKKADA